MRTSSLLLCLGFALAVPLAAAETLSERVAAAITRADRAVVRQDLKPKEAKSEETLVVADSAWIRGVASAIAATPLGTSDHCWCIGYRTAYFHVGEEVVASVAVIHENQLRLSWEGGGGDFKVDEARWKAVAAALAVPPSTSSNPAAQSSAATPPPLP